MSEIVPGQLLRLFLNFYEYEMLIETKLCSYFTAFCSYFSYKRSSMEGNTGQNCYKIVCSEELYRTTWLYSRISYIVPDMLYYRNGDASMSYHMLLYRTRCCCIVTGVLSCRNGDAIMSYHILLYRTRCFYIVTSVLLYRSSDAVSSYQMLLYRTQCCYIVPNAAIS